MAKLNFETREQALAYLDNMPLSSIKSLAADALMRSEEQQKITVSEEQFNQIVNLFKIRGINSDGEIEKRGRRRKE